jgi:tetratricopeptide (TPR) repeat protein
MPHPSKPRCIVLPFQDRHSPGTGLALQFLLSNVIAAHTAFRECWFGWRTAQIFPQPMEMQRYCESRTGELDLQRLAITENVQCWVQGQLKDNAVDLHFFNAEAEVTHTSDRCAFTTTDGLVGFRRSFANLLDRGGFPISRQRLATVLWSERIDHKGLSLVGRALEAFYLYSAFGAQTAIDLALFQAAVRAAPDSFMAHDLLGWAHYRRQLAAEARASFLRALVLNPDASGPMAGLMACAVLEKDQTAALYWAARKAITRGEDVIAAVERVRKKFEP